MDCKLLNFIDISDKLIPAYFAADELKAKGAILTIEQLLEQSESYLSQASTFKGHIAIKKDVWKRLYLAIDKIVTEYDNYKDKMSLTLKSQLVDYAGNILFKNWQDGQLPLSLKEMFKNRLAHNIKIEYNQWRADKVSDVEAERLDNIASESILVKLSTWDEENSIKKEYRAKENRELLIFDMRANRVLSDNIEVQRKISAAYQGLIANLKEKIILEYHDNLKNTLKVFINNKFKEIIIKHQGVFLKNIFDSTINNSVDILIEQWINGEATTEVKDDLEDILKDIVLEGSLEGPLQQIIDNRAIFSLIRAFKANMVESELAKKAIEEVTLNAVLIRHPKVLEEADEKRIKKDMEKAVKDIVGDRLLQGNKLGIDNEKTAHIDKLITSEFKVKLDKLGRLAFPHAYLYFNQRQEGATYPAVPGQTIAPIFKS